MGITNVTKIEVSADSNTLLVSSDEGATVFIYHASWTDSEVVEQYSIDDDLPYSRAEDYDTYKNAAGDWRTIYEV